jgi:hypothetical protein
MKWRRLQFLNLRRMDYVQLRALLCAVTVFSFLFLDALAKLRKATINFIMSCLPACLHTYLSELLHRTARHPLDGF